MIPNTYKFPSVIPAAAVAALSRKKVEDKQLIEALAAVGYPQTEVIPRIETLTPAQRAVVEVITEFGFRTYGPGLKTMVPDKTPDRRRWLGLDAPGPLERLVPFGDGKEPIWRALALSKTSAVTFAKTFPLKEQLELWGEVYLTFPSPWGIDEHLFLGNNVNYPSLAELKNEGREWAPKYADALLVSRARKSDGPLPVFLALVRAKVQIEPRWDVLLPLGKSPHHVECVEALPAERRGAALVAAMRAGFPGDGIPAAIALLPLVPDVEVAKEALAQLPKAIGSPVENLKKLVAAAKGHPEVLAVFASEGKDTPKLTVIEASSPKEFSAAAKKQIVESALRYSGKKLTFEKALIALELLECLAIANEKGKHTYDVWLYQGDSGTVFTAGTTKVVAELVQRKVEGKDKALNRAIEDVLRQPVKKRRK